jgi:hypothetical protein
MQRRESTHSKAPVPSLFDSRAERQIMGVKRTPHGKSPNVSKGRPGADISHHRADCSSAIADVQTSILLRPLIVPDRPGAEVIADSRRPRTFDPQLPCGGVEMTRPIIEQERSSRVFRTASLLSVIFPWPDLVRCFNR